MLCLLKKVVIRIIEGDVKADRCVIVQLGLLDGAES